jgi:hypothetical protein
MERGGRKEKEGGRKVGRQEIKEKRGSREKGVDGERKEKRSGRRPLSSPS